MNLSFPQLLAGSVGALLIYCAIVNKTPVQVIQEAFGQTPALTAQDMKNPFKGTPGAPQGTAGAFQSRPE